MFQPVSDTSYITAETFPEDPAEKLLGQKEPAVVYGPPGSYVDLSERAQQLKNALANFGLRNQRLGFDLASNSRQYKAPIWSRYAEGTPIVQEGANANGERFLQAAKVDFWQATGYAALRDTRLASKQEIDAGSRKMWREFSTRYGAPENRVKRDKYKQLLGRSITNSKKILKRAA